MKIAAACCTYLRPQHLGAAIDCFCRQTHEARKLVILDDAGQYGPLTGDRWELHSVTDRYPSLGAKRNAVAALALADPTVDAIAVMDDDDFYFPHWLSAIADALTRGPWCVAGLVYTERPPGELTMRRTPFGRHFLFHACWGFRRETFERVGGYDVALSHGEDIDLYDRLEKIVGPPENATPEAGRAPYFLWNARYPGVETRHLSSLHPGTGYDQLATDPPPKTTVEVGPLRDFSRLPVRPEIVDQ